MELTQIATAMTAGSVVAALSSPLVGTPAAWIHEGNSAPARTLVDGLGKSERSGERRGAK